MKATVLGILSFSLCFAAVQAGHAQTPPPTPAPGVTAHPGIPGTVHHEESKREEHHGNGGNHGPNTSGVGQGNLPSHNALQLGPVGRWWDDKSVVNSVGLSMQQQRRMDSIFDANRSAILSSFKSFQKAQQHLQAVNKNAHPDQTEVFSAIDAVNAARSDLQKAASAMLLQIRGEMSPDQIDKLEKLQ